MLRLTPRRLWALAAFSALAAAAPALAQDQDQLKNHTDRTQLRGNGPVIPQDGKAFRVSVNLVRVPVTVVDPLDRVVTGLDRQHFRVFENKVEQEITHFSSEDVPLSVAIILDVSGSMSNKYDAARLAAVRFMQTANPQDEYLVISFSQHARLVSHFTSSVETLRSNLLLTPPPKGRTALYDAVYLAFSQMRDAQHGRKAILIISDGADNHSRYNYRDIRELAREAEVQLYSIGIFDPHSQRRSIEELHGPEVLWELTELTGGRAFTVQNLKDLPDIAAKIGYELRNQYMISYRPANSIKDGKWRKIQVKLKPPRGLPPLQAFARTGYRAP